MTIHWYKMTWMNWKNGQPNRVCVSMLKMKHNQCHAFISYTMTFYNNLVQIHIWELPYRTIYKGTLILHIRISPKHCPVECKRLAYIALVRSTLEYGAIVWERYKQQDIRSLDKCKLRQEARFIKIIIIQDLMVVFLKCLWTLSYRHFSNVDATQEWLCYTKS